MNWRFRMGPQQAAASRQRKPAIRVRLCVRSCRRFASRGPKSVSPANLLKDKFVPEWAQQPAAVWRRAAPPSRKPGRSAAGLSAKIDPKGIGGLQPPPGRGSQLASPPGPLERALRKLRPEASAPATLLEDEFAPAQAPPPASGLRRIIYSRSFFMPLFPARTGAAPSRGIASAGKFAAVL